MTVHKFALTSLEYKKHPFPTWTDMRDAGPVIRGKIPVVGNVWMFTTFNAASKMLRDDELYVRDPRKAGRKYVVGFLAVMPKSVRGLSENMLSFDGTEHRRLRGIVDKAFQMRSVEAMSPQISDLTNALFENFDHSLKNGKTVDLVANYARDLPLAVISELLGLPEADRKNFQDWGLRLSSVKGLASIFRVLPGLWRIRNYIKEQIKKCRKEPRPGLLSDLVHAEHEGEQLSDDELLAMGFLLLVAGHETTVHLISTAIANLLQHPEQLELLRGDWSQSEKMVDEVMRFVSPVEISKPRMLSRDVNVHGQELKRGDYAVAMLGAANHDPDKFSAADLFDITRENNHHLGFGTGIHVCLGMKLAKTETEIAIKNLFEKYPTLQLAVSADELDWSQRIGFRSLNSLPVRLG